AIALSIPNYGAKSFPLGNKIRLFAEDKNQLEVFNVPSWLNRLTDYVDIESINRVPDNISEYAYFKRVAQKGKKRRQDALIKKAEYQSTKFNIPYDSCLKTLQEKSTLIDSELPFISVQSLSTDRTLPAIDKAVFPLFITMKKVSKPQSGLYTCYGLSRNITGKQATIPCF
ncbi:MAG: type I-F CRISPR-associated endoribonuclease Cas6/Csy4, partial [Shewanella sp.]